MRCLKNEIIIDSTDTVNQEADLAVPSIQPISGSDFMEFITYNQMEIRWLLANLNLLVNDEFLNQNLRWEMLQKSTNYQKEPTTADVRANFKIIFQEKNHKKYSSINVDQKLQI